MTAPVIGLILLAGVFGFLAWATRRNDPVLRQSLQARRTYRRFDLEGEVLPPATGALGRPLPVPTAEFETRRPERTPSLESDVWVPVAQSIVTALIGGLVSGLLALAFEWPAKVVLLSTAGVLAASWLWRLRLVDRLLWRVEVLTQHDLTGDAKIGAPHAPVLVDPARARQDARHDALQDAQEGRRRDLLRFLHVCATVGTSERAHNVSATGPDRERYIQLRDALFQLGLAQWRSEGHPRAGWVLTLPEGEASQVIARHVL